MVKGWTMLGEGTWRHDSYGIGQNRLNIYELDFDEPRNRGRHVSEMPSNARAKDGYGVFYTNNEEVMKETKVVDTAETLKDAKRKATKIRKNNFDTEPEGKSPVDKFEGGV